MINQLTEKDTKYLIKNIKRELEKIKLENIEDMEVYTNVIIRLFARFIAKKIINQIKKETDNFKNMEKLDIKE